MAKTKRYTVEERTPGAFHVIDTVVRDAETGQLGKVVGVCGDVHEDGKRVLKGRDEARREAGLRNDEPLYDLVGTAEAAEILDVERPRIGRWKRQGLMPMPITELATGPIWLRKDIEALKGEREQRRRHRG